MPIYSKTATAKSDFILKHLLQAELPAKDHDSAKKNVALIWNRLSRFAEVNEANDALLSASAVLLTSHQLKLETAKTAMLGFAARLIAILSSAQIPDSSMPGPDEVITCARMQTIWSGLINRYLDALDRYLDCVTGAEPGGGSGLANAITGILSGSTEEDPPYEPPKDCSVEARILDEIVKEMADAAVAVSYICRNE